MNIWIVGKDLMKKSYHQNVSFIVHKIFNIFQMMIMPMQLMYGILSILII